MRWEYLSFVVFAIAGPSRRGDRQNERGREEQRWLPACECFFYRCCCLHFFFLLSRLASEFVCLLVDAGSCVPLLATGTAGNGYKLLWIISLMEKPFLDTS